jgi:glutamine synthetase
MPTATTEQEAGTALLDLLAARNARRVYLAVCDLQGQLRGKSVSIDKFHRYLEKGFPVPPILGATDFTDVVHPVFLYPEAERLGDGLARVATDTAREIPWEPVDANLLFLAEMVDTSRAWDPRALYRQIEDTATAAGLRALQAIEYECSLLRETHESVHAKSFRDLQPVSRDAALYGLARHSAQAEFWNDLVTTLEHLGIHVDACHWELAPAAVEVVIRCEEGVRAADQAVLCKTFAKSFAQRRGLMLTFMARLSHLVAGHSGHVHISLLDADGTPAFFDAGREHNMSLRFLHFIGGLQRLLPELALMLLPNVNSWRRLDESAWSFDARWCRWGIDNRSAALRVMPGDAQDLHLECRIPGADANPYLALACVLAAGLYGIDQKIDPTEPVAGNAFKSTKRMPRRFALPETFAEAIQRFKRSRFARDVFGDEFVRVFAETRACQEREFRNKVSEWELRRFLESG